MSTGIATDLFDIPRKRRRAIGGHQSARMKTDVWLTPPHILMALGPFDLDPCAPAVRPWDMAAQHYCLPDNGLLLPWHNRVFLNPPFGDQAGIWLRRLADHGNGVALVHARTETQWFFAQIWRRATAVLFLEGRERRLCWLPMAQKMREDYELLGLPVNLCRCQTIKAEVRHWHHTTHAALLH